MVRKSKGKKAKSWDSLEDFKKGAKDLPELPVGVPRLTLTGYAYHKLCYWEAMGGKQEISCFGVTTNKENPLRVTELYIPEQKVTKNSTDMTADGIARMWDELLKKGLEPVQFARIWIHTHPFKSEPSEIDYTTCREVFMEAGCDWFVMLIKGNDGFTCNLYTMGGLPLLNPLHVGVDYARPGLPRKIVEGWTTAFKDNVTEHTTEPVETGIGSHRGGYLGSMNQANYCAGNKAENEPDKEDNKVANPIVSAPISIHQPTSGPGLGQGSGRVLAGAPFPYDGELPGGVGLFDTEDERHPCYGCSKDFSITQCTSCSTYWEIVGVLERSNDG